MCLYYIEDNFSFFETVIGHYITWVLPWLHASVSGLYCACCCVVLCVACCFCVDKNFIQRCLDEKHLMKYNTNTWYFLSPLAWKWPTDQLFQILVHVSYYILILCILLICLEQICPTFLILGPYLVRPTQIGPSSTNASWNNSRQWYASSLYIYFLSFFMTRLICI